jgi:hypothetical protein
MLVEMRRSVLRDERPTVAELLLLASIVGALIALLLIFGRGG